jgi:hypothetical protein
MTDLDKLPQLGCAKIRSYPYEKDSPLWKIFIQGTTANLSSNDPKQKNATNQFLVNSEEKVYILRYKAASMGNQIPMFRGKVLSSF